jgi:glycosyltransferase involved in cell wall biosynthesis
MNIALLSEKYTPDVGGLAISSERIATLLAGAGHQVHVYCPSASLPPSETRTHTHRGVSITRLGPHRRVDDTLVEWLELIVAAHKRSCFDVLHAYSLTQAGFVAAYAGRYLNLPSVVSIRGNDIERAPFDPDRFSHVWFTLKNAGAVTANASALIKKARAFLDREITLVPNGVDTRRFRPMERNEGLAESLGLSKENRVIGFVGELREKKGLATLLHAYAKINRELPVTLLIIGDIRTGEDRMAFDEIKSSIPNGRIVVTGYVSNMDLPSYYSVVDVLLHPSLRDGLPNAVLEAMACGKAVIATPVGGVLDVLSDGKNGRMVAINDINSLTAITLEVLSDKMLQIRLGAAARQTIENQFTLESELEGNLEVYCKLGLKK